MIVATGALGLGACSSSEGPGSSGGAGGNPGASGSSGGGTSGGGVAGSPGQGGSTGVAGSPGHGGATGVAGSPGQGGSTGVAGSPGQGGSTGVAGSPGQGGTTGVAGGGGTNSAGSGGGPGTGGKSGAGGPGGGAGGSPATGGSSGCLICDDFETGTSLDAAKWVIDTSMGAAAGKAEIVSGGAHGSAKAVKVSGGYIKVDAKAGLFSGVPLHFFMRINMKFDMAQPSGHVTYIMLADKTKNGQLRIGAQNGGMIWNYDTTDSILPDYNAAAMSLKPAANSWHCFEFEIDGNAPVMRAWMDGTESSQMLYDATSTAGIDDRWMRDMPGWKPNITNFGFGSGYPTGSIITWFDDIAISASRIGCQF